MSTQVTTTYSPEVLIIYLIVSVVSAGVALNLIARIVRKIRGRSDERRIRADTSGLLLLAIVAASGAAFLLLMLGFGLAERSYGIFFGPIIGLIDSGAWLLLIYLLAERRLTHRRTVP